METTLRQEIRNEGIATRRHISVVAESLRGDIRIVAEGLIALDAKVERIRGCRDFDVEDCNGYRVCFGQDLAVD